MKRVFFAVALLLLASVSSAVTVGLMPTTVARFWNYTGTAVLSGGYVVTCPSGASCGCTSFTAKTSYTDSTGLVANANPVYLNSRGEASIWLDTSSGAYKITTCDRFGVLQTTTDGVIAIQQITSPQSVNIWQATGLTPTFLSTVSFSVLGDYTTTFTTGRRLKIVEGAGTVYSSVSSTGSSYAAGVTTVYTTNDVSPLDAGISSVAVNLVDNKTGISSNIPGTLVQRDSIGAVSGLYLTSGATVSNGTLTITANIASSGINSWSGTSSFATGTGVAPFTIPTSTTVVTNLNSDMLDGFHASATPSINQIPVTSVSGQLTLPASLYLGNDQSINCKSFAGVDVKTLFIDPSSVTILGNTGYQTNIKGSSVSINGKAALRSAADAEVKVGGYIDIDGTVIVGAGFNSPVSNPTTGNYVVTFNPPFLVTPVVVVSGMTSTGAAYDYIVSSETTSTTLSVATRLRTDGSAVQGRFNFIAIGTQ